jgi:hypothetical protein
VGSFSKAVLVISLLCQVKRNHGVNSSTAYNSKFTYIVSLDNNLYVLVIMESKYVKVIRSLSQTYTIKYIYITVTCLSIPYNHKRILKTSMHCMYEPR